MDHFPEATALYHDLGLRHIYEMSPALQAAYQWGDEEHPRDIRVTARQVSAACLAGLLQGDPAGPYVRQFTEELSHIGPPADPWRWGLHPTNRFFYFYNPY